MVTMNGSFEVFELASTKTTRSPGWAYIPDVGPAIAAATLSNRKRVARNHTGVKSTIPKIPLHTRIQKELDALDREQTRNTCINVSRKTDRSGCLLQKVFALRF